MDINAPARTKVKYIGTTDVQVNWGDCDDPRSILTEGEWYEVEYTDIHSWHTKVKLIGIKGRFNSCSFE